MSRPWDNEPAPMSDRAFDGDPSVGFLPEIERWSDASQFAKRMERRARHAEWLLRELYSDNLSMHEVQAHLAAAKLEDA